MAPAAAVVEAEVLAAVVETEALEEDQAVPGQIVLALIPREVTTMIQNWE